jgi:hypothetical protein
MLNGKVCIDLERSDRTNGHLLRFSTTGSAIAIGEYVGNGNGWTQFAASLRTRVVTRGQGMRRCKDYCRMQVVHEALMLWYKQSRRDALFHLVVIALHTAVHAAVHVAVIHGAVLSER